MPAEPTTAKPDALSSIEAWTNSPQFRDMMRDEFPEDAGEWLDPVSRRAFLSLSAAGIALAAGTGCNPSFKAASQRKVVPYVKQPEGMRPGIPLFFATAMPGHGGVGLGLIAKQVEGRPIKVEGNPDHPGSRGKCDLAALASTLDMYDPDRSGKPVKGDAKSSTTFEDAVAEVRKALAKYDTKPPADRGDGVRLLTAPTTSPTVQALMERFLARYPRAVWAQYEPVTRDNLRKATKAAFGKALNPVYNLTTADVILALDADFLNVGPGAVRYSTEFGARRTVSTIAALAKDHNHEEAAANATKNLNRLYVVEAMPTSTGVVADHRLPLKPSEVEAFARALAAEMKVEGVAASGELSSEVAKKWVKPLADDLLKSKGKAVVIAGEHTSAATQLVALAINKALDAFGKTVSFTDPLEAVKDATAPGVRNTLVGWPTDDQLGSLKALADDMKAGKVDCLLMSGVNPVYDAPADLKFADAIDGVRKQKSPVVLHHGLYQDETADKCNWHVNAAHYLESWGDVRAHDGTVSVIQPLIAPLYGGKTFIELLAAVLEEAPADGLSQVRKTHEKLDEKVWETGLKTGVFAGTEFKPVAPAWKPDFKLLDDPASIVKPIKELEISFRPDPVIFDGQQANNGWLQELPKPVTNLCWDNAAMVSPRTADKLRIQHGYTVNTYRSGERGCTETDLVELTVNGRKLKAAVHVLTGHADDVVTLHLGYGRSKGGRVASPAEGTAAGVTGFDGYSFETRGAPGFNAYALRGTDGMWTAKVDAVRSNERFFLAIAGAHAAMESRRPVRYASKAQFINDPEFAQVPAVAAAEVHAIVANTPGTPSNFKKQGLKHPHAHEDHEHKPHDPRVIPLNLYHDNPIRVNGKDANTTYRRWAMAIDLSACTGCGACTLACVAENNIPVVGKEQVHRGRAMHWIRIDRYYTIPKHGKLMSDDYGAFEIPEAERKERAKETDKIQIHVQPVPCQQCEKAPCEVVCPVAATVHSADGLNDMVYNRCVGTRYCANNCPYKVRRFNFLHYTDYTTDSLKLLNNPEVTVRTRGVMEKCTYCVQRIRVAEIEAEREWAARTANKATTDVNGRPKILDGEVVTACQQACPTGAIKFGDMSDPSADILKWKAEPHTYGLLAEINTMPRTTYLAAIKNPNPVLEAAVHGKGA